MLRQSLFLCTLLREKDPFITTHVIEMESYEYEK